MSKTSIVGALGIASQTAKGTPATTLHYIPATALGLEMNQTTQVLPAEIAGSYFPIASYKGGVSTGGDVSVIMRPDGFGHFLYALAGQDTVTPVAGQTGAYSHVFTPFAAGAGTELPWMTLLKDVAKLYAEQYVDSKLSSLRLDLNKQTIATAQASFFGITPSEVAVPGSETFDFGPSFQLTQAVVTLNNEVGNAPISSFSSMPERITLDFRNNLSQDEFVVGSFYPADVTLLQRTVDVSYDIVIRDPALIRAVYHNGGTGAWSPQIFRGHLHITLQSSAVVPSTTQTYQLDIDLPGIDFLMMPVPLNGSQLIRANLSAHVSLGTSGADTFTFTLINGTATY